MQVSADTATTLAYAIQDFHRTIKCVSSLAARIDGRGLAMHVILKLIDEHSDIRAVDLAAQMGIGQSVLSRHLADLETADLLERFPDENDRRVQRLQLTAEGKAELARSVARRVDSLREALDGWNEQDARLAVELMNRLDGSLKIFVRPTGTGKQLEETLAGAK